MGKLKMESVPWEDSPLNIKNIEWTKEEEQNMEVGVVDLKSEAIRNLKNASVKIKRLKIPNNSTWDFGNPKVHWRIKLKNLKHLYRNTTAIILTSEAKQKRLQICHQIVEKSHEELFDIMAPKDLKDEDFDDNSPRCSELDLIKKSVENSKEWAKECMNEGGEIAYYIQNVKYKNFIKKYDAKSLYF